MIDTTAVCIFVLIMFFGLFGLSLLNLFNKYLPKWFCDNMGWHLEPPHKKFDGCSSYGICPRCGKKVLQDSQGNWF